MTGIVEYLTVFVLAAFVGIEVVSKVPSILHTPLMSGSNAIHGIVLVGALTIMETRTAVDPGLPGRVPRHPQRGGWLHRCRPCSRCSRPSRTSGPRAGQGVDTGDGAGSGDPAYFPLVSPSRSPTWARPGLPGHRRLHPGPQGLGLANTPGQGNQLPGVPPPPSWPSP